MIYYHRNLMSIEIVNKKFYKRPSEYIGRPSPLGNPYSYKEKSIAKFKVSNTEEAISKYEIWLYEQIKCGNKEVINEINRLLNIARNGDLFLGCWCVPFGDCHGRIVKELLERVLKNERK